MLLQHGRPLTRAWDCQTVIVPPGNLTFPCGSPDIGDLSNIAFCGSTCILNLDETRAREAAADTLWIRHVPARSNNAVQNRHTVRMFGLIIPRVSLTSLAPLSTRGRVCVRRR